MGILNFHKWMHQHYPSAFQKKWLESYDHVYIDINFALHHCSYGAKTMDDIYKRLYAFIDSVLYTTNPKVSITIAADGSAPLAKLLLQRKRRLTKSRSDTETKVSSIIFTPGTEFMNTLEEKISNYVVFIKHVHNINVIFEINNHDEAELKLKRAIMSNNKKWPDDSHVIVTNDADVTIMLMTLIDVSRVYVFEKGFQNSEIISIGKLLLEHIKNVGCSMHPNLDFSALTIMMGNDYLPKINYFTFDKLWDTYKYILTFDKIGFFLDDNLTINPNFFNKLLLGIIKQTNHHYIKKVNLDNLGSQLYNNYMDGFTWCLSTYVTGICTRYNYMYGFQDAPHPFGLLYNIKKDPHIMITSMETSSHVNKTLYSILVLPYKCRKLIDAKYKKFLKKTTILYEEEQCKLCSEYHEKMGVLNKKVQDKKENTIEIKNELTKAQSRMMHHKKTHGDLTLDDIEQIIKKFTKFTKKLNK
jgi:hypothetical protein